MTHLLPLPIVLPLLGAAASLVLYRHARAQRVVSTVVLVSVLVSSVALLVTVVRHGPVAVQVGGWEAPIGITLVADQFAALMLVVSMAMVLAVLIYAIGSPLAADDRPIFHPVYLVLTAGVAASFLTGDLFNLFVAFEMMLIASYVLLTLGATRDQVRTGMTYVVISLLASTFFITAVAFVYASLGTLNMAQLNERIDELPTGLAMALGLLLLVVFGIKAAIFPLFFWLPDSYPTAPTPVTAIFAGLLTKVGVYAIIRTQTLLFSPDDGTSTLLLWLAGATMVVGVLGAIAQDDMKRILSFHIISQIGYMVFGLALFTVAGIAATIFYVIHHIVVKTSLFLVTGLVEAGTATAKLRQLGGLLHRAPAIAVLFAVPALSLAGLPPFSGFIAKLALVEAGMGVETFAIVAVSLFVSLLTLFSMTKIWSGVFWGEPEDPLPDTSADSRIRAPRLMVGATGAVVLTSITIAVMAGPLYDLALGAGQGLADPSDYVHAVLPR